MFDAYVCTYTYMYVWSILHYLFGLSLWCLVWAKYVDLALSVENCAALDMCFF